MIRKGSTVNVHYVGKLSDGVVFDSSEGKEPLQFQVGSGQIIPGFEEALIGKKTGDKITINIQPEFAYGHVREELIVKVPIDKMPGKVEVGQYLHAVGFNNQTVPVLVKEISEDHVVVDGNHPLAGKELTFDIEIISVN